MEKGTNGMIDIMIMDGVYFAMLEYLNEINAKKQLKMMCYTCMIPKKGRIFDEITFACRKVHIFCILDEKWLT